MSGWELLKSREAMSIRDVGVQGDINGEKQDNGGKGSGERAEDGEEMV